MDKLRVADAMTEIFNIFKRCNKYIDETMPWALAKEEEKQDRLATVLYNLAESIMIGASLLEPFMPTTAKKIAEELNGKLRAIDELNEYGKFVSSTKVAEKPEILFMRLDEKEVMEKVNKMIEEQKKQNEVKVEEKKEIITIDDFDKVDLRVAKVLEAEAVEKSDKLLKLKVSLGNEERQILAGIQKYYKPEELIGRKLVIVANLAPRKMRGLESQGMVIAAGDGDVVKVLFVDDAVEAGESVH